MTKTRERTLIFVISNQDKPPAWISTQPAPEIGVWPLFPFSAGHVLAPLVEQGNEDRTPFEMLERLRMKALALREICAMQSKRV